MAITSNPIKFDSNGLYVVLAEQSQPKSWHWTFYLHIKDEAGCIFHIRKYAQEPWCFEHKSGESMLHSLPVVVALRVATIKPEHMRGALQSFLGTTQSGISMADPNQFGTLTCRTWVMQALYELDQGGYISIIPGYTVQDIALQATETAQLNSAVAGPLTTQQLLVNCQYTQA